MTQNILIDYTDKDKHVNQVFNQVAFISTILIDLLDELAESTEPMRQYKKALKDCSAEAQKVVLKHYRKFEAIGEMEDDTGVTHSALDIYNNTSKAYLKGVEFFAKHTPNEIVGFMGLIEQGEREGIRLSDVPIVYDPLLQPLNKAM